MANVFISYRREDSAASAGRLFDRFSDALGAEHVFRDIDAIAPGAQFAKVIDKRIDTCDALIAVIGRNWLTVKDANGHRRLDDANDYVKAEIRTALELGKRVIPVLVEGASMPAEEDLPEEIAPLAGRNAIEVSETRFDYDARRLIDAVQSETDTDAPGGTKRSCLQRSWIWLSNPGHQRTLTFLGGGIAIVVTAMWTAFVHLHKKPSTPDSSTVVFATGGGAALPAAVRPEPASTLVQPSVPLSQDISGSVTDESDTPIQGAKVVLMGSWDSTLTQQDGGFSLPVNGSNELVRLSITKDGFRPLSELYPVRRDVRVLLRRQ